MADADIQSVVRSFKFRLLPSKRQHAALEVILESQRVLYNAALESRLDCYRKTGKYLSYITQCKHLTEMRQIDGFSDVPANLQRWTLQKLEWAYKEFFSRIRNGDKPGLPRFKAEGRWRSFGFAEFSGLKIRSGRILFKGLPGRIRINIHRTLPHSKPLCCTFRKDTKGWYICLQYEVPVIALPETGNEVGLDLGIRTLCALSTGEKIPNPRAAMRLEREVRRKQRALARCKRGSKRRAKRRKLFARCYTKITRSRRTYLDQVSSRLVRNYDLIVMEALNLAAMRRGMLSKSVYDAAWGKLKRMITYKAESAGRLFVEVDPKDTTQACSRCGSIVPKKLSERWHSCPHCGLEMDRDENAARNVLRKGVLALGQLNVAEYRKRVAGNLKQPARAA